MHHFVIVNIDIDRPEGVAQLLDLQGVVANRHIPLLDVIQLLAELKVSCGCVIRVENSACGSKYGKNAGFMESLGSNGIRAGETETERETEGSTTTLFSNLYTIFYTCVCSMNTFYTSSRRTDRSTHNTSKLIKELLH